MSDSAASVNEERVRIGVLGCGNVGAALVGLIDAQGDMIEARTGLRLEVAKVAVRNMSRERPVELADGVLTNDAMAVVDDRLRVHGIQGLRIADASIMPTLTSGNTNAPAIMIGEKAADMVLADAR